MKLDRFELEELAAHICGRNYDDVDYSEIEQSLFDKFNIDYDSFQLLVEAVVPMVDIGSSRRT